MIATTSFSFVLISLLPFISFHWNSQTKISRIFPLLWYFLLFHQTLHRSEKNRHLFFITLANHTFTLRTVGHFLLFFWDINTLIFAMIFISFIFVGINGLLRSIHKFEIVEEVLRIRCGGSWSWLLITIFLLPHQYIEIIYIWSWRSRTYKSNWTKFKTLFNFRNFASKRGFINYSLETLWRKSWKFFFSKMVGWNGICVFYLFKIPPKMISFKYKSQVKQIKIKTKRELHERMPPWLQNLFSIKNQIVGFKVHGSKLSLTQASTMTQIPFTPISQGFLANK